MTKGELARRAGVSKGTLVQLEQGGANPSIATLCRLANALGVSVADIVSNENAEKAVVEVTPNDRARRLWSGPHGGSAVLLAGTRGPDMLELWQWELKSGERFEAVPHSRGTREIIHVVSGRLMLETGKQETVLGPGTTAIAHTDRPHAYANSGRTAVRFFMTVHEPSSAP